MSLLAEEFHSSGTAFGCTLSASASYKNSSSGSVDNSKTLSKERLTLAYNVGNHCFIDILFDTNLLSSPGLPF